MKKPRKKPSPIRKKKLKRSQTSSLATGKRLPTIRQPREKKNSTDEKGKKKKGGKVS